MPPQPLEIPPLGPIIAVPEFRAYLTNMSDEEYVSLGQPYVDSNVSPNHAEFQDLCYLIERCLKVHKARLEDRGRPSQLDDRTIRFALETGVKNCAGPLREMGFAWPEGITGGPYYFEMFCLTLDLEDFAGFHSEGHQPHSRGARGSQQPSGRHPAESSHRRADALPQDTRDRRRGPPHPNSNRHAGPSRQSGQASRGYNTGQASRGYGTGQGSRRRYEEESSSDGDW